LHFTRDLHDPCALISETPTVLETKQLLLDRAALARSARKDGTQGPRKDGTRAGITGRRRLPALIIVLGILRSQRQIL
jgi:hypothetical protein